ncbi:Hpt domain-containing protein [Allosphingosinicella vermicomposti]|uniref:Hpt domain-containing protein n=1 Tax=Allosphingosinicella vermicomposti TaxID=614671 RepID=UPI000D0F2D2F|nr:Hpt domain-containing protein [Allosphingosinicella vermicomposti]
MSLDDRLAQLRAAFAERSADDMGALRVALDTRPMDRAAAQRIAHRFAGAAGLYGFQALGEAASALDDALEANTDDAEVLRLFDIMQRTAHA